MRRRAFAIIPRKHNLSFLLVSRFGFSTVLAFSCSAFPPVDFWADSHPTKPLSMVLFGSPGTGKTVKAVKTR